MTTQSTRKPTFAEVGEDVVKHFGVKGMHWGIRKEESHASGPAPVEVHIRPGKIVKTKGGQNHGPHQDALSVAPARQIAKKSSPDALSNKELQDLVSRMNLEQQYSRLIATDPHNQSDIQRVIKQAVGAGKTINNVIAFVNSPAGKALKAAIKAKTGK